MDLNPQYLPSLDRILQFRNMPIAEYLAEDIGDHLKQMKADGWSRALVRKECSAIKSCIKAEAKAVDWEIVSELLRGVIADMSKVQRKSDPVRPDEHLEQLIAQCDDTLRGHRNECLLRTASALAIGRAVVYLRCDEIEKRENDIGYLVRGKPFNKGTKAYRALRKWMNDLGVNPGDDVPLFVRIVGTKNQRPFAVDKPLSDQSFNDILQEHAGECGIEGNITSLGMRSGAITYQNEQGVTVDRIARWTGISDQSVAKNVRPSSATARPQDLIA